MDPKNFTITFLVEQTPAQVFAAVNNVRGWWSAELEGESEKLNDVFAYRHQQVHYSRHQLTEVAPDKKIVWLVTESKITFVPTQDEWTGTEIIFDISIVENKTQLQITHLGLVPTLECYEGCSKGWTYYLQHSLLPLITTGKGNPDSIK